MITEIDTYFDEQKANGHVFDYVGVKIGGNLYYYFDTEPTCLFRVAEEVKQLAKGLNIYLDCFPTAPKTLVELRKEVASLV